MKREAPSSSLILIFLIWLFALLACANNNNRLNSQNAQNSNNQVASQPATKPVVDIPVLIGKSPTELDRILGKPTAIAKITNDPEMMPGEYRDYKIENSTANVTENGLMVRFYRGQAVHFTLDLPRLTDTPEEALLMAGIDVKGMTANITAPLAHRWTGNFNGIDFRDVAALKMDRAGIRYSTVQAEWAK